MILNPHGTVKQRLTLTAMQIAAILGLDAFMIAHGLILVCPRCLAEGDPFLETDNSPHSRELKIDCRCKERRIASAGATRALDADGELLATVDQMLAPIGLSMRCAERRCITHPLDIRRTADGLTELRCRCAKTTIHPPHQTRH